MQETQEVRTVSKVIQEVQSTGEAIKNDEPQIFPAAANVGDNVRQGDIYIVKLEDDFNVSDLKRTEVKQLAEGVSKGSRHIATGDVEIFERKGGNYTVLDGPVLKVNSKATVEHPEHGDWKLEKGFYGVNFQRAYAEELRRIKD